MGYFHTDEELEHHGILGQKWGVRRFQNEDGTLTSAGRSRYDTDSNGNYKKLNNAFSAKAAGHRALSKVYGLNEKAYAKSNKTLSSMNKHAKEEQLKKAEAAQQEANERKANGLTDKQKKAIAVGIGVGAVAVSAALAVYGGTKLKQIDKVTTKGLKDTYEGLAKLKFADAASAQAQAVKMQLTANSDLTIPVNKKLAKDWAVDWQNASDRYRSLGDELRKKGKSNDFSVKEKVEFVKQAKNNVENFDMKKYMKSVDYAKAAAQESDDYLEELLKRSANAIGF